MGRSGSSKALLEANTKFVSEVNGLLEQLEGKSNELSEKAKSRADKLRSKVQEQQDVIMPKLKKQLSVLDEKREEAREKFYDTTTPLVRKAVTGDEELAVSEFLQKYEVVKTWDKLNFVLGVLFIQMTQYILLRYPEFFRFYFAAAAIVLMAMRVHLYGKDNMHYFMLDYCYLTNTLCIISALFLPNNPILWKLNFAAANGPLMWAIVAWRNSLVFHSLDKQTSLFIHVVPSLLTFAERWLVRDPHIEGPYGFKEGILGPMAIYFCWQIAYLLQTEVIDRQKFENDPTLMTSLRWIAKDKKNLIHGLILRFGRETNLLKKDEALDMKKNGPLIIAVFVFFQFSYTLATIIPGLLFYRFKILHQLFIVFICVFGTWNGANFYFEVFAKRYIASLEKQTKKEKKKSLKRESKRASNKKYNNGLCAMPNEKEREQLVAAAVEPEGEPPVL